MKTGHILSSAVLSATLILVGCQPSNDTNQSAPAVQEALSESEKANALFEEIFMEEVMRSPMYQTYLGIKDDYDKLDDYTDANADRDLEYARKNLERLGQIDPAALDEQTALSYELMRTQLEDQIADNRWRYHNYPVNQMFGMHSGLPSFMINQHVITDISDAEAYISRLNEFKRALAELEANLYKRAEMGILAPRFVYPYVLSDINNVVTGAPFTEGPDSTLLADFKGKLTKLDIEPNAAEALVSEANKALLNSVGPGFNALANTVRTLEMQSDTRDGAWKLPDGDAFYNRALARTTTTDMDAETIHNLGLAEVERIHGEMRDIMRDVNFDGDLQAFFEFTRVDSQFYYPDTPEGKERYLSEATAWIDDMKARLDTLFLVKPQADLVVKAVEPFREKSAGKAFYQRPAPDGSRPGTYYANLYTMEAMPIYQMEALAYHEGIPGHHMQIAIAQELQGIPKFRRFGGYTAYTEGWGLYAELIPKEIGLYDNPYSDFGRLAMELWRACRLVVDTGIHAKQWTREEAIDYLKLNTPNPESDIVKAIERYIVMPSQATAYKVGMLKILELRERAKQVLGEKFDIREFHDAVLKQGPLPLTVLEGQVDIWIAKKQDA
jgi:uncharacterized protein (DUF885 family)